MKSLKEMKYLLLDLDGVCYGKHNNYSLEKVFGQVSNRMTSFISERLKIDLKEAKKLQTDYFYRYNTSLNGLMIHHDIPPQEFLKYVHDINYDCLEKDIALREELLKLDVKTYCATNGSKEHAINCMKKIGIDDLFEGKIMDIVDFNFKPKPNPECYLKAIEDLCPTNGKVIGFEDTPKGLQALVQTPATSVLITQIHYPEIDDFKRSGAYHFRSLSNVFNNQRG